MTDFVNSEYDVFVDFGGDGYVKVAYESLEYDKEPIDIKTRPMLQLILPNTNGEYSGKFSPGTRVKVLRNGDLEFIGIVEPTKYHRSVGKLPKLTVIAKHEAWCRLEKEICDDYDFSESGTGLADVIVNPWQWIIFRNTNKALTTINEHPAVDGFTIDKVCQAIIGTKFLHQSFFTDNSILLPSTVSSSSSCSVYIDGRHGQTEPRLQLNYAPGFVDILFSTGTVESIPLYNGDPNVTQMGNVSNVTITVYGIKPDVGASTLLSLSACRNASDGTRTYTVLTESSFTARATDDDYDKWVFTGDLSGDGASTKNEFGYKITISKGQTSLGADMSTAVVYLQAEVTTVSDTGITDGYIETYDDQSGQDAGNDLDDGRNFVELSVFGKTRLDALADIQGLTVSRESVNQSPHWDIHLTAGLEMNFIERRGEDLSRSYSFGNTDGRLRLLDHEYEGDQIYYQVFALGAGNGIARSKIVSREEFDNGGLYFSELDPNAGAKYGIAAGVGIYDDNSIVSATNLLRRARAFAKLHSKPISVYRIEVEPEYTDYFDVGDTIIIDDVESETYNEMIRIVSMRRKITVGSIEVWDIELGQPQIHAAVTTSGLQGQLININNVQQPTLASIPTASDYVTCTTAYPGVFTFNINEPKPGDRWLMSLEIIPWQINNSGSNNEAAASQGIEPSSLETIAVDASYTFSTTVPTGGTGGYIITLEFGCNGTTVLTDVVVNILDVDGTTDLNIFDRPIPIGDVDATTTFYVPGSYSGKTLEITYTNRGLSSHGYTYTMIWTPITNSPSFGIWQFDGDTGTGNSTPIYGEYLEIWVDPDNLDILGAPTVSSRGKVQSTFGNSSEPRFVGQFDITPYMLKDANGIIVPGAHNIRFKTKQASAGNSLGLSAQRVQVIRSTIS